MGEVIESPGEVGDRRHDIVMNVENGEIADEWAMSLASAFQSRDDVLDLGVDVDGEDPRPGRGHRHGDGPPDPAPGAGDDDAAVTQPVTYAPVHPDPLSRAA